MRVQYFAVIIFIISSLIGFGKRNGGVYYRSHNIQSPLYKNKKSQRELQFMAPHDILNPGFNTSLGRGRFNLSQRCFELGFNFSWQGFKILFDTGIKKGNFSDYVYNKKSSTTVN